MGDDLTTVVCDWFCRRSVVC